MSHALSDVEKGPEGKYESVGERTHIVKSYFIRVCGRNFRPGTQKLNAHWAGLATDKSVGVSETLTNTKLRADCLWMYVCVGSGGGYSLIVITVQVGVYRPVELHANLQPKTKLLLQVCCSCAGCVQDAFASLAWTKSRYHSQKFTCTHFILKLNTEKTPCTNLNFDI